MFVDGSPLNSSSPNARASYDIVFPPLKWFSLISSHLKQDGHPRTSNRVERLAVSFTALRFLAKFSRIVLAIWHVILIMWIKASQSKFSSGVRMGDDYWESGCEPEFVEEVGGEMEKRGMLVQFWKIPRDWNEVDEYAKAGAVIVHLFLFQF